MSSDGIVRTVVVVVNRPTCVLISDLSTRRSCVSLVSASLARDGAKEVVASKTELRPYKYRQLH